MIVMLMALLCAAAFAQNASDFKTDEITSAKGIVLIKIPAGTFTMGSPATEAGRFANETQHSVTLTKSFYIGKYLVTQEQYQAVMGSKPSWSKIAVTGESGTPGKLPVEQVSWYDALVFCNKLSVMEGLSPAYSISGSTDPAVWGNVPTTDNDAKWDAAVIVANSTGYRLPTEAQWEYACRAGKAAAFNDGNNDYRDRAKVEAVGWFDSNSGNRTHQVGLKTANAWGLYDMHGNVWEWCWDWYKADITTDTTDPLGASSGGDRVGRGGLWGASARYARSAWRSRVSPSCRNIDLGFRLVRP
jgi:formylglycine-generating enzyme required for sulfatase activity